MSYTVKIVLYLVFTGIGGLCLVLDEYRYQAERARREAAAPITSRAVMISRP